MIGFNGIPSNIRVPLVYIEFDNTRAISGTPGLAYKVLVIGQKLATGSMAVHTPLRITSTNQAIAAAGQGSQLAAMLVHAIKAGGMLDIWAVAQEDASSASAAQGTITVTANDAQAGVIALYIAGMRLPVAVAKGDTSDGIAGAIAAAIEAAADMPVAASVSNNIVTLTAKNAGENGNTLDVRDSYHGDETLPGGVVIACSAMTGGAGNPDITEVLDALGDAWYNIIACPYTDSANLNALRDDLLLRWGPTRMIDGIAFIAKQGDFSAVSTFGEGRNDFLISCMDAATSPTPPYIWAAVNAAVAASSLSIDPARPLQTLVLPGVLAPKQSDIRTLVERNLLLHSGISAFTVDASGQVLIERQITTYQENALGAPDPSYLDVNTPATLSYLRYSTRLRIQLRFPRHKLADNGTLVAPGQPIVTPNIIKAELIALAGEWLEQGLVENLEQFKNELVVERNANDRNRIDVLASPDLINQFRIFAEQIQFIL